jgi:hypothetical protein
MGVDPGGRGAVRDLTARVEALEAAADPAMPEAVLVLPDNGRGQPPPGSSGVVILAPDDPYWTTGDRWNFPGWCR